MISLPSSSPSAWTHFWAKTNRHGDSRVPADWTHPLWAHLIDVANAADVLYERIPLRHRDRMAELLGMGAEETRRWLTLLVGLHDAGKAVPGFQSQSTIGWQKLEQASSLLTATTAQIRSAHHGFCTLPIVLKMIEQAAPEHCVETFQAVLALVAFHHGRIWEQKHWCDRLNTLGQIPDADVLTAWDTERWRLVHAVAEAWGVPGFSPEAPRRLRPKLRVSKNTWRATPWLIAFAGWATMADWLGSISERMPVDAHDYAGRMKDYVQVSRSHVETALKATNMHRAAQPTVGAGTAGFEDTFSTLFDLDDFKARALQRVIADLPDPTVPTLTIIEGPTGEGKSEGAFHRAGRLQTLRAAEAAGIYTGMPTQATSNGLFPRFVRFLETVQPGALVQLVHGASGLNLDLERLLEQGQLADERDLSVFPDTYDDRDRSLSSHSAARAGTWFLPSKRGLLAPYGIGTVDQALLGALLSRHFFLRLFGMAGKTVIFDEVHAYDSYMAALFCRLLAWLQAVDAHVVVLSATLPVGTRAKLVQSWGARPALEHLDAYPAVTVAEAEEPATIYSVDPAETAQAERVARTGPISIEFLDSSIDVVAEKVKQIVSAGATVAVIVNLVDRAQRIFGLLQGQLAQVEVDVHLLHARFPFEERQKREIDVVGDARTRGRFGKKRWQQFGRKPAVLIATQVAEQSLDLDVDVMLSDLAPVDLLLQRAGRMHRHDPPEGVCRPDGFRQPRLLILCPDADADPLPAVHTIGGTREEGKGRELVYLNFPLLRTYCLAKEQRTWTLPQDYRALIEAVYGPEADTMPHGLSASNQDRWIGAIKDRNDLEQSAGLKAAAVLVPDPSRLDTLFGSQQRTDRTDFDEDDNPGQFFAVRTRLGLESVSVVCLELVDGQIRLGGEPVPLPNASRSNPSRPSTAAARTFLYRSLSISRQSVVRALNNDRLAGATLHVTADFWTWVQRAPALMRHVPLVFQDGQCVINGEVLHLDQHLGLVYPKRPFE